MRQTARKRIFSAASLAAMIGALAVTTSAVSVAEEAATVLEKGKETAFDRKLGNCLACHAIDDGTLPGNIGPPLIAMKQRYPEKAKLRDQIWDATVRNPNTIMPPFGRFRILSEEQIDWITEYIYTQ
ncbi:MAG: sulfur oxidation c-type cytochrome SoxX [Gammaproteobacteria bacterium]